MKSAELIQNAVNGVLISELPETKQALDDDCAPCCIRCKTAIGSEDERLVQGCLEGDQHAWESLIDKYKRLIYSIPFKYGASPEDAADVFQAVCIELFNSLSKVRKIQSLRSWLITVTIHQSLHWKRKRSNALELDAMEPETIEEIAVAPEVLEALQQEQALREAIRQLPPRCAELLRLLCV